MLTLIEFFLKYGLICVLYTSTLVRMAYYVGVAKSLAESIQTGLLSTLCGGSFNLAS